MQGFASVARGTASTSARTGRCASSSLPEYRKLADLANSLQGLIGAGAYVVRGEQRRDVASFREAMDWLMAEARGARRSSATRASAR